MPHESFLIEEECGYWNPNNEYQTSPLHDEEARSVESQKK